MPRNAWWRQVENIKGTSYIFQGKAALVNWEPQHHRMSNQPAPWKAPIVGGHEGHFTLQSMFVFFSSPSHFLSCCCGFSNSLYFSPRKSKNKDKNKWRDRDTMFKGSRINCTHELKDSNEILDHFLKALKFLFEVLLLWQLSEFYYNEWPLGSRWRESGVKMLCFPSFDCVYSQW